MRFVWTLIAVAAALLVIGLYVDAAKAEPRPDPPPGGYWDGTYVDYAYLTYTRDMRWRVLCFVPGNGDPRTCWKLWKVEVKL